MEIILAIINIALIIMLIVTFIFVIKLWNFQQEVMKTGGYPTVLLYRAKRDARELLAERPAWELKPDEIVDILGKYPDDAEAVKYCEDLTANMESIKEKFPD